jgi:Nuclease-related domain
VIGLVGYPLRLSVRRWFRACGWALGAPASALAAAVFGERGAGTLAFAAVPLGLLCLVGFRFERRRARRALIGARSERAVRRALGRLEREGWRVRRSVRWPHGGDIDHIATAPSGAAFVIETKTRGFSLAHLARSRACASWVACRRRPWAPAGVTPVLCVVRGRPACELTDGVLVVSIDRLAGVLRSSAGPRVEPDAGTRL